MYNMYYRGNGNNQRVGFLGPFLLGGLIGGTAVGVARPRPVYVNPSNPSQYPYYGGYGGYYGPRPFYY